MSWGDTVRLWKYAVSSKNFYLLRLAPHADSCLEQVLLWCDFLSPSVPSTFMTWTSYGRNSCSRVLCYSTMISPLVCEYSFYPLGICHLFCCLNSFGIGCWEGLLIVSLCPFDVLTSLFLKFKKKIFFFSTSLVFCLQDIVEAMMK